MGVGTRDALLERAEHLIRTRGYAAFSYADLADSIGIRKASVHHHFPQKVDLGSALIAGYVARLQSDLDAIRQFDPGAPARLAAYAQRFRSSLDRGMLPLCAALAAERDALPAPLQADVTGFFRLHLHWLLDIVREGIETRHLRSDIDPLRAASLLLSTLEGGSLVGWALQDTGCVLSAFQDALQTLVAGKA